MAYEIFDDIAFYYMSTTVLAIIALPWTAYRLYTYIQHTQQRRRALQNQIRVAGASSVNLSRKSEKVYGEGNESTQSSTLFTPSNIAFALVWLLLIVALIQLPSYNIEKLASYNPYDILGVESGATDKEIQRAYRKLSLQYHPDKNVNQTDDFNSMFIKVSKAYQTLTDPAARENLEKYGNPDGYSGVSVTIGLPSFLTDKSNETRILLVYFLCFMVLPPAIVLIWWRTAKAYTETGVLKRTLEAYFHLLTPTMAPKFLIEVLSFSAEFEQLQHRATDSADFTSLYNQIKDTMVKQRFFDPTGAKYGGKLAYVGKASVLLHAYLQRTPIPQSLQADLNHILKYSHKLLNAMLEVAIKKGMLQPIRSIVTLMQFITQSMWFDSMGPLMQLPHFDSKMAHLGIAKGLPLPQMLKKPENKDKREKLWPQITAEQWTEIDKVANMLPDVQLDCDVCVEDNVQPKNVYAGDLVLLTVDLYRNVPVPAKDTPAVNGNEAKATPSKQAAIADKPANNDNAADEKSLLLSGDDAKSSELTTTDDSDDDINADEWADDELLDKLALPTKPTSHNDIDSPLVHSLHFPYEKHEKWVLLLLEKSAKGIRLAGVGKVPPLNTTQTVELRFMSPGEAGTYDYDVVALCDSYIGCDTVKQVKLTVLNPANKPLPKKSDETVHNTAATAKGWFDDEDDENYAGKWYYFGLATFWELVLNVFVLSLLCIFIFNFLVSRGWWHRYIQPGVDWVAYQCQPVWTVVQPTIQPVLTPVQNAGAALMLWLSNKLTVEPVKTKFEREQEANDVEPDMHID